VDQLLPAAGLGQHHARRVEDARVAATPYHLGDGWLIEALPRAGLVFDRTRLAVLAEEVVEDVAYSRFRDQIDELSGLILPEVA
jgi:hypothetical protein